MVANTRLSVRRTRREGSAETAGGRIEAGEAERDVADEGASCVVDLVVLGALCAGEVGALEALAGPS